MINFKSNSLVLLLFIALTIFMTYPVIFKMGYTVKDLGDPLLSTWILSWDIHKITTGDIWNLFNANIFYPHERTLAYSEHLLPQALFALPPLILTKNPVFAYNFVLLFAFVTSGFGMYLLARYLTGNSFSGIIAGIIFAFSTFMFAHLGHLQVISAGGLPLSFLFLHKFFESESYKHLLLFTLFYLLQVLSNSYYALYLTLFAGLYMLYYIISRKKYREWSFLGKMVLFAGIVMVVAGPFFYQYIAVRQEMGFVRTIDYYADIKSYLCASSLNRLYGKLTAIFREPEGELFPGITAVLLVLIGLIHKIKNNLKIEPALKEKVPGLPIIKRFIRKIIALIKALEENIWIYVVILVLAFLFTFGPKGPYILLYKFVPGFDGLRVASRFHIFVMFSIAVLAAFGVRCLLSYLKGVKKLVIMILIPALILIEYLSIPVPAVAVPVKGDIPDVYKWLARQKEDFSIIEYPIQWQKEFFRVYYSTYHRKKMVNGHSGYSSPTYRIMLEKQGDFPSEETLKDINSLGIKFILLHSNSYQKDRWSDIIKALSVFRDVLQPVGQFDETYVYEIKSVNK